MNKIWPRVFNFKAETSTNINSPSKWSASIQTQTCQLAKDVQYQNADYWIIIGQKIFVI